MFKNMKVTAENKMVEWFLKGKLKTEKFLKEEKGEGGGINWTATTIAGIVIIGLALLMFKDMLPALGDNIRSKVTNFG